MARRLVNAMAWHWFLRGRLAEARRALEAALAVAGDDGDARGRAAAWHAGFVLLLGEQVDWEPLPDRIADAGRRARALLFLAMSVHDLPLSQELVNRALVTFRATGDRWGIAAALSLHAKDHFTRRDLAALERDCTESARLFRELGDRWGLLQATEWLAGLAETAGDGERAKELFARGAAHGARSSGLWPEVARRTPGWAGSPCRRASTTGPWSCAAAGCGWPSSRATAKAG